MPYRVGQWATGNVGGQALRAVIEHPDLELAGVVVSDPAKAGRDAADLCGVPAPTGILATTDPEEVIAARPDAICYTAVGTAGRREVATGTRPTGAVDDLCRILAAGIDVVSTSIIPMVHPPSADPETVQRLRDACATGRSSILTSGLDPGIMNDVLPLALSSICLRIESIRVSEVMNYGTWDKPEAILGKFGFGKPLDHRPPMVMPGVLTVMWGTVVHLLADRLGVVLDAIEEHYELFPAPETFVIPAGTIEKGTSAAMRFEVRGMLAGRPAIVAEHVTRLRDDLAPHWPAPPGGGGGGYRVQIEGEPSWTMEITNPGVADPTVPGTLATALRVVNAIPAVCEAEPGVLTPFDLPMLTGRHLLR
ncbi:diacylglycerol kinase [Actinomadura viridis]|uniref:4-hydroxy-tetrahydrodipicolinate reductase n=1 Tax=Actinomadura viridis TaxID=58110 RepID=A0A931GGQ1_9ACTN|nr:diacylglycerol kinase [Actinomadura viridis]MBG6086027.1 4-hydroxy-tetrahydrodipicolinate reductase [Actinomadura viridis]